MKRIFCYILVFLLIYNINCYASSFEQFGYGIRVGIIDSGVNKINDNVIEGFNFLENNKDTIDNKGHGTAIANIIMSIAPNAKIIPLKCTELNQINDNSSIITAVYQAVDTFQCDVLNISIGMPDSEELSKAISYAIEHGVLVVSAVGNDGELAYKKGKIYYPAGYDFVVGVGSVDEKNNVTSYSQKNESVFIVTNSEIAGTSYCAAKISGAAAIAKGFHKGISAAIFKNDLKEASKDFGDEGYDTSYGFGILDFDLFLNNLKTDYPVYITYLSEKEFRLYNSKKETASGTLIHIGNKVISDKIEISPGEELIFSLEDSEKCFFWQQSIFDIVWVKKGV